MVCYAVGVVMKTWTGARVGACRRWYSCVVEVLEVVAEVAALVDLGEVVQV